MLTYFKLLEQAGKLLENIQALKNLTAFQYITLIGFTAAAVGVAGASGVGTPGMILAGVTALVGNLAHVMQQSPNQK